jgi:hypothetical protein
MVRFKKRIFSVKKNAKKNGQRELTGRRGRCHPMRSRLLMTKK